MNNSKKKQTNKQTHTHTHKCTTLVIPLTHIAPPKGDLWYLLTSTACGVYNCMLPVGVQCSCRLEYCIRRGGSRRGSRGSTEPLNFVNVLLATTCVSMYMYQLFGLEPPVDICWSAADKYTFSDGS